MNVGPSMQFALAVHNGPQKFVPHLLTQNGSAMNCWARANECRLTKRCTAAGYVFGFSTSFASFEILGYSTVTRVGPPDR